MAAQSIEQVYQDGMTTREIRARALGMLKAKNPGRENRIVYVTAEKKRAE